MAVSLELAISAIRSGRKEEGRQLLNLLIQQNPNDDKAWLWMSSVVDNDEQRARCLYHVLAINPTSELARRGLQVLGITVSDSRPVKIPRDSQPIQIPKPTPAISAEATQAGDQPENGQSRRPFLINPETISQELPFTPVSDPFSEPIQASPGILDIDVEAEIAAETADGANATVSTQTQEMEMDSAVLAGPDSLIQPETTPGVEQAPPASPEPGNRLTKTQRMGPGPAQPDPASNQPSMTQHGPLETRPSQPVPVVYPNMNMGPSPNPYYPVMPSQGFANHGNVTLGMPPAHYPQPMLPGYANPTLGMPLPGNPSQPPADLRQGLHSNSTIGMTPFEQQQLSQMLAFHSNATMMMPTMSEAEARARLMTNQAIPTANATAMALQSNANGRMDRNRAAYSEPADEEEEGEEMNVLAIIIFGTLSITALGGFGMLILLVFLWPIS
jgi:hypothetical protein